MINACDISKPRCQARFGNKFFRNICGFYIAKSQGTKCKFDNIDKFQRLGIDFSKYHIETLKDNPTKFLPDDEIINYINNKESIKENEILHLGKFYCQTYEFAKYLFENFNKDFNRFENVSNNDLFIHVRCGDINMKMMPPFEYYIKAINGVEYSNGYLASDNIEHDYCKKLRKIYNLNVINLNDIETIKFGSQKKNIILSPGTFSWMIGFLSNDSNVYYYPPKLLNTPWHGPIFEASNWKEVIV